MADPLWHGERSRKITKRIVVECDLVLETPAHFGSGDEMGAIVPLIMDETSKQPLLTGASIAGALRSYLWSYEHGYGRKQTSTGMTAALFGGARQDQKGDQSCLIVDDAYGSGAKVELRDGVKIDPKSRTAEERKLYTFMVWSAGAKFPLRFELLIAQDANEAALRQALAIALSGLQSGEITLGARKRRGYGRARAVSWRVREFDLTTADGLIAWVNEGGAPLSEHHAVTDLCKALNASADFKGADKRQRFTLRAQFALEGSLLIRADSEVADMGHLRSNGKPVLSGTSLAGAIRARALKIAKTLAIADADTLVDEMFGIFGDQVASDRANGKQNGKRGSDSTAGRAASRVIVEEHLITDGETERWVQSRVSIDRFTGGALDTALFDQQPQFGGKAQVNLELRSPNAREIGLLLLVLKDLWTSDLPLGGESSVGRGRLRGLKAQLAHNSETWEIAATADGLDVKGDREALENYVRALQEVREARSA